MPLHSSANALMDVLNGCVDKPPAVLVTDLLEQATLSRLCFPT